MTTSKALRAVWLAATNLYVRDPDGEHLIGLEAVCVVAAFHGERWDRVEQGFYEHVITPGEYAEKALAMIEDYRRHQFRERLERKLVELGRSA